MAKKKSHIDGLTNPNIDELGRSYYLFCLEQALVNIGQARAIVKGDIVDENHELPLIENLLAEAIGAS